MVLPLKCSFLPDLPKPRSPVHRHLKFSAVLGTTSASRPITILRQRDDVWYIQEHKTTDNTGEMMAEQGLPSNRFATYFNVEKDARILISIGHL